MRRKKLWAVFAAIALVTGLGGVVLVVTRGSDQPPRLSGTLRPTKERSRALMALAAQEAALIQDVDARLTRLLNLADTQIQRNWLADARDTLGSVRAGLR